MPLLAAAADFERTMRVGTLEITAALAAVALLAARPRVRAAAEIALSPMLVELEVLERGGARIHRGRTPLEIGRVGGVDLVVRDPEVSRRHARLESEQGVVYVEDLKSSNGTFLNGRRVTAAIEIRRGDEIDVGSTRMVVRSVRAE